MRILLIRFSSLGDVVLASAPLRALNALHPDAEIVLATKREYAPLFEGYPEWLKVAPYDSAQSVARFRDSLRSAALDLIVDLHGSLRSRILVSGMKCREKRTVDKQSFRRFRMVWNKSGLNAPISTLDAYLRAAGVATRVMPKLQLSDTEMAFVAEQTHGQPSRLGIGWGAKHPTKAVPAELWKRLLGTLSVQAPFRISVFGVPGDRVEIDSFIAEFAEKSREISVQAVIGRTLRETMTQIAACQAFVSSDSGLMHVADALGVPTFGLFGPTHPSLGFAPAGPLSKAFHAGTWCSPCHRHGRAPCFRERRFCFDGLDVDSIASDIAVLLRAHERVA